MFNERLNDNKQAYADNLLKEIKQKYKLTFSQNIQDYFDKNVKNYNFLNEFTKLYNTTGDKIIIVPVPDNLSTHFAHYDINRGLNALALPLTYEIPYINIHWNNYNMGYEASYNDAFICFFVIKNTFKDSEEIIFKKLTKFQKLKGFM
jgi:hypothetical protein